MYICKYLPYNIKIESLLNFVNNVKKIPSGISFYMYKSSEYTLVLSYTNWQIATKKPICIN